jgi:excisionase family DNA binding protein
MSPDLVLVHIAAKALGMPRRTVRYWAAIGKLEATKPIGKIWFISRASVEAQLAVRAAVREISDRDGVSHGDR